MKNAFLLVSVILCLGYQTIALENPYFEREMSLDGYDKDGNYIDFTNTCFSIESSDFYTQS